MPSHPRILSVASAQPRYQYSQEELLDFFREQTGGQEWARGSEGQQRTRQLERLFTASRVERRRSVVDPRTFYHRPRTTGERMAEYQTAGYALGRAAVERCLAGTESLSADDITDLVTVSCTGYGAPGLDIQLARDLGMARDLRRVAVGHMGCFGALVGIRQCLATLRAYSGSLAILLSVELSSLHFCPSDDAALLTLAALFGDAAAAVLIGGGETGDGPAVIDTYCVTDYATMDQMSWTISDYGFVMDLSPRVPVTLRRHVAAAVHDLLGPHELQPQDIAHWLVHPGGPSILEAIQSKLELSDQQMGPSWRVLREHGNCSSATVLLILEDLLQSGRARPGEWGVMMAFGPGLTLETCLLRF